MCSVVNSRAWANPSSCGSIASYASEIQCVIVSFFCSVDRCEYRDCGRYLCGHDHNLQHIRESTSPVDYFVVGAGHLTDPSEAHKVGKVQDKG